MLKEYTVVVDAFLSGEVKVKAKSRDEAISIVNNMYQSGSFTPEEQQVDIYTKQFCLSTEYR